MNRLIRAAAFTIAVAFIAALAPGVNAAEARTTTVTLPTWHSTYDWPTGDGRAGWSTALAFDPFAYGIDQPAGGTPGLWLWLTGEREYYPGGAEWHLHAPGTTRIANVSLRLAYRDKLFAHHCVEVGLRAGAEVRDGHRDCNPPASPATQERYDVDLEDPSAEPTAKEAYIRVEMPQCNNPDPTPCSKWIPALDPVTNGATVRADRVALELVDDDRPIVAASGPLRDLAEHYTDGTRSFGVTVSANDPGSGVHRVSLDHVGSGEVSAADAPCDPHHNTLSLDSAICPAEHAGTWTFDTNPLTEGAASFAAHSTDLAGNAAPEDAWRFFVDRTAPPQPSDFDVDLDADAELATVSWLAQDDPPLADGNPGSGLAEWEYRWRKQDGEWRDWQRGVEALEVPDAIEGDTLDIEARSLDAVGNRSAISSGRVTIPTEDDEDDTVENEDDDDPEDVYTASAARARTASSSSDGTITLEFVAATAQRREQADVDAACSPPLRRMLCSEAVTAACRRAGICTTAKRKACAGVKMYCPVADASRISLVARYQPTFVLDRKDRFWPVSVNTAIKMRWDNRETKLLAGDDTVAEGATGVRRRMAAQRGKHDDELLDLPPHKDDTEDFWRATQDALGIHPRLDLDAPRADQNWDAVPRTGRIYWYRGGGFGKGSGTAKSLQYWTFYTYNYLNTPIVGGQGKHEGDWEMAAVVLGRDDQPVWTYMSRHGMRWDGDHEARRFTWNDDAVERDSTHVTVYPAKGSHAVYNHCDDHKRDGAPDDHSSCSDVLFCGPDTRRISLGRTSWACWGGHFGKGDTDFLHRYGDSPFSPLWQQDTFAGDRRPCADGQVSAAASSTSAKGARVATSAFSPVASAAATTGHDPEETESIARETQLSAGGDPLIDEFSRCELWAQPPTQPGATLVACDQKQLDAFIAAGLTGGGGGGPSIVTPDKTIRDIPATYSTDDASKLGTVSVVGTGAAASVYAARLAVDGTLEEAAFPAADLPRGERLVVRFRGAVAELVTAREGRVIGSVVPKRVALGKFRMVPRARMARAVRRGRKVIVTWRGSRRTRFILSAGPTEGAARRRRVTDIRSSRNGRYRAGVRLRRGERWIGLMAYRGSATSLTTTVRVRRR